MRRRTRAGDPKRREVLVSLLARKVVLDGAVRYAGSPAESSWPSYALIGSMGTTRRSPGTAVPTGEAGRNGMGSLRRGRLRADRPRPDRGLGPSPRLTHPFSRSPKIYAEHPISPSVYILGIGRSREIRSFPLPVRRRQRSLREGPCSETCVDARSRRGTLGA